MIKISFGIIVLNGMPFVKYCLRQLYPFAYEIIVVEGASINAKEIATKDGHSTDKTLEALEEFKKNEDTENKLKIITKKGFWSEKDEQSQAYAKAASGDYLWQVDIDEFYKKEDIKIIIKLLNDNSQISGMSFEMLTFWGGLNYLCNGWYLMDGADIYYRLFKWDKNYKYITHRPPTVVDNNGVDLKDKKWISGSYLRKKYNLMLYHYSLLFPKQVIEKCQYYEQRFGKGYLDWAENSFLKLNHPFRVHNVFEFPSWLLRHKGTHPQQIYQMMKDIKEGKINIKIRDNQDVEKLLSTKVYHCQSFLLSKSYYIYKLYKLLRRLAYQLFKRIPFLVQLKRKIMKEK